MAALASRSLSPKSDTPDAGPPLEGVFALTLEHYAPSPVDVVRTVPAKDHAPDAHRSKFDKPRGLWVSVKGEDDWPSWCESEGFALDRLTHPHRVHLSPNANILYLSGEDELLRFTEEWGSDYPWGNGKYVDRVIDWERVARAYDGIVIAPYVWSCRMGQATGWYYGWDCASGCIWNARAIERLAPEPASPADGPLEAAMEQHGRDPK